MVMYLYPEFRHDPTQYQESVSFWTNLCDDVLKNRTEVSDWETWCSKPFLDGNPIYDLVSASTGKGFRIIQLEPGELGNPITAWTDTRGGDPGEEGTWDELVISCELSKESAASAKRLLVEWVQFEGLRKNFEPTIERILAS